MTTSTNNAPAPNSDGGTADGGVFADALTLVRLLVTPVVMALIIWGWPEAQVAALASILFVIAAVTDIFDDYFGGGARSPLRSYGYLDDIADTVLIIGSLIALSIVIYLNGLMHWAYAVPVFIIIAREIMVGFLKGYELSRYGWPDNFYSSAKAGFAMLGTVLLVGAPWLTNWVDRLRANEDNVMAVFSSGSPLIWVLGQGALWLAAIFSLISAYKILTFKRISDTDGEAS